MSDNLKILALRLNAFAKRLKTQSLPPDLIKEIETALHAWEEKTGEASPKDKSTKAKNTVQPPKPQPPLDAPSGATYHIWSDGSCSPNPGKGGWGAILEVNGERRELAGASPTSTNNIMEMTGAIEALRQTPEGAEVHVTTDSQYVKNGITQWIHGWKKRGWRKADGDPVLNQDQWKALDQLTQKRKVTWAWIKGHSGHAENERCDELANQARLSLGE